MRVTLEPAWQVPEAATFFRNVWPMYLHDLSQYALDFFRLDNLGLWQPDIVDDWVAPVTRTDLLREARSPRDPGHPFQRAHVISAGGCRSGFVCVGLAPFRHMPQDVDCIVAEMFVVPRARGRGTAAEAVAQVLAMYPGRWFLEALGDNVRAIAFWRKTLGRLGVSDLVESHERGDVAWRFRR